MALVVCSQVSLLHIVAKVAMVLWVWAGVWRVVRLPLPGYQTIFRAPTIARNNKYFLHMSKLNDKLKRIERYLNIFSKTNTLLREIEIPISEKLENFIASIGDEFELYDGYELNEEQLKYVNSLLPEPIEINMKDESYHIVTVGIYDWDK
jgi:hypothetical protein